MYSLHVLFTGTSVLHELFGMHAVRVILDQSEQRSINALVDGILDLIIILIRAFRRSSIRGACRSATLTAIGSAACELQMHPDAFELVHQPFVVVFEPFHDAAGYVHLSAKCLDAAQHTDVDVGPGQESSCEQAARGQKQDDLLSDSLDPFKRACVIRSVVLPQFHFDAARSIFNDECPIRLSLVHISHYTDECHLRENIALISDPFRVIDELGLLCLP